MSTSESACDRNCTDLDAEKRGARLFASSGRAATVKNTCSPARGEQVPSDLSLGSSPTMITGYTKYVNGRIRCDQDYTDRVEGKQRE